MAAKGAVEAPGKPAKKKKGRRRAPGPVHRPKPPEGPKVPLAVAQQIAAEQAGGVPKGETKKVETRGRKAWKPTKKNLEEIEALSAKGLIEADIMLWLGISKDTFYKAKAGLSEFREALKRGKLKDKVKLLEKMEANVDLQHPASIFFKLKVRHGYRENAPPEPTDTMPVFVEPEEEDKE